MADHGKELAADLDDLFILAHTVSVVAGEYRDAAHLVAGTELPVTRGSWTSLHPRYLEYRDLVHGILTQNHRHLMDTEEGLVQTVKAYMKTDHEAAEQFRHLKRQHMETSDWD